MEGWTEISADWIGEGAFTAKNETGGVAQMGSLENKPGIGPMQMLLTAIAGCTGSDIVSILRKKRTEISDLSILVRGRMATDYPKIWTDIHLTYLIWGPDIQTKDLEQAIRLSEEKYCSVGIMLGKSANITSEYKIFKPGEKFSQRSKE